MVKAPGEHYQNAIQDVFENAVVEPKLGVVATMIVLSVDASRRVFLTMLNGPDVREEVEKDFSMAPVLAL